MATGGTSENIEDPRKEMEDLIRQEFGDREFSPQRKIGERGEGATWLRQAAVEHDLVSGEDMLEVLAEKTRGNLSEEEDQMLQETISQVKMAFVQLSK